jgi:DsbC/DsbD-like thiol-disulfide interchange protein
MSLSGQIARRTLLSGLLSCGLVLPLAAADAPSSVRYDHSEVSLLSAGPRGGKFITGVDIVMRPGWKTYWRMPGDAGVPPNFDWTGSVNLKEAKILWPAPQRYHDEAGETIGYIGEVVFPIEITPVDAGRPVELNLDLFYAVCKDICIPGSAKLARTLNAAAASSPDAARIAEFEARVPSSRSDALSVDGIALETHDDTTVLSVGIRANGDDGPIDIFVEGAEEVYFRKPEMVSRKGASDIYRLKIDGLESPADLKGRNLTLTVVRGRSSVAHHATVQ